MTLTSGLISLAIFLIAQLVGAVWWASSMATKMDFMLQAIKTINTFSTKEEVETALINVDKGVATAVLSVNREISTALALANKETAAIWKKIDEHSLVLKGK